MNLAVCLLVAALAQAESPEAESAEVLETFRGHTSDVYDVAVTLDGRTLASAGFDGVVKLWEVGAPPSSGGANAAVDRSFATLQAHSGKVLSVAFSSDGRLLLTGGEDKIAKLWSVPSSGTHVVELDETIADAALLDDGVALLVARGGKLDLVQPTSGASVESIVADDARPIDRLAVSADGRRIGALDRTGRLRVWSRVAPAADSSHLGADAAELLAASSRWRFLRGKDEVAKEWSTREFDDSAWDTGEGGFGYSSSADELKTVRTRLDDMVQGGYLSLYLRGRVTLEDPARVESLVLDVTFDDGFVAYLNGTEVARRNIEGSPPSSRQTASAAGEPLAESIDLGAHRGLLVVGENVLAIQAHNASAGSSDFVITAGLRGRLSPHPGKPEDGSRAREVEVGPDARVFALSSDGAGDRYAVAIGTQLRVGSLAAGSEPRTLALDSEVRATVFAGEGEHALLLGCADGSLRWIDLETLEPTARVDGVALSAFVVSSPRSALLAVARENSTVDVLRAVDGSNLRSIPVADGGVTALAFSADDRELIVASAKGVVRVLRVEDGVETHRFEGEGPIRRVFGHPSGSYHALGAGARLFDWRPGEVSEVGVLGTHGGFVHAVAMRSDGTLAATAGQDKTVRVWSIPDRQAVRSLNGHEGTVYCLAFSQDGKRLASAGYDKAIRIWNVEDGSEERRLEGHVEAVFDLAWSATDLYSASSDRTVRRWSGTDGAQLAVLEGHPGWVCGLGISADGTRLVSVDYGGTLITWDPRDARALRRRKVGPVVYNLALPPGGEWVVTANPGRSALRIGLGD